MKKGKLTLGLVVSLTAIAGLASCNEVTYSDGVVLTYTDQAGNRLDFTANELFGTYQTTTGQISTDFSTVEEVLIRKYYQSGGGSAQLATLTKNASLAVQSVKDEAQTNATNNKTSYQEEFEKLLDSNGVENIDELYEAKLYELERESFENDYSNSDTRVEGIRDGSYEENGKTVVTYPYSADYGRGNEGYLLDQLPYHVSHILVNVAATNGDHTQGTITTDQSKKISDVVAYISGEKLLAGSTGSRSTFGNIALQKSDDKGSAAKYGMLDVMDRKQADSFVNEFKFGIYAFESIYNHLNLDETKNPYATKDRQIPDGSGNTYKLYEKLKFSDDATYTDSSFAQSQDEIDAGLPEGEHFLKNYFNESNLSIGSIPYGAAVAMGIDQVAQDPKLAYNVNDGDNHFYPRNILFNKYFNSHWVSVITPDDIPYTHFYNEGTDFKTITDEVAKASLGITTDYTTENFEGINPGTYASLPGFSVDTTDVLPQFPHNVLTNEKGQIILAVRAGSSGSYEGIHFMAIERSALSEYGVTAEMTGAKKVRELTEADHVATANVTSLKEYYTNYTPTDSRFPTYTPEGGKKTAKTTYINQLIEDNTVYEANSKTFVSRMKSYNSVADTFRFQYLINDGSIAFNSSNELVKKLEADIKQWISVKREDNYQDGIESFDDSWATYAEYLLRAEEARALKADGTQKLISETCAIGYLTGDAQNKTGAWAVGGACYAKK